MVNLNDESLPEGSFLFDVSHEGEEVYKIVIIHYMEKEILNTGKKRHVTSEQPFLQYTMI